MIIKQKDMIVYLKLYGIRAKKKKDTESLNSV